MSWLAQKVFAYEHMRFAQEPDRRVLPFAWGLEHIGGAAKEHDPRGWLENFARAGNRNQDPVNRDSGAGN